MQCKYQNRPGKSHECCHPLILPGYSCILDDEEECTLQENDDDETEYV